MLPRYIDNLVLKNVIEKTFKITWNQDNVTLEAQKGLFKMAKKSKEIRTRTIKTI